MINAPSDADARFDRTIDRWFRDQLALRPETATYLGLHDTDDQLSPGGRDAVDEEVAFYRRTIDELSAIEYDETETAARRPSGASETPAGRWIFHRSSTLKRFKSSAPPRDEARHHTLLPRSRMC